MFMFTAPSGSEIRLAVLPSSPSASVSAWPVIQAIASTSTPSLYRSHFAWAASSVSSAMTMKST